MKDDVLQGASDAQIAAHRRAKESWPDYTKLNDRQQYDPILRLMLDPSDGDRFTFEEFKDMVETGTVTRFDGTGYYSSDGVTTEQENGITDFENLNPLFPFVFWFNK